MSSSTTALPSIKLTQVGKLYYKQEQKTLKEMLPALVTGRKTSNTFWALRHVNLMVQTGETLGILGPNGSGKSTMLKLMAGVSKPTEGQIEIRGKIAPLIELGAGFHPELTGKENIFLNGVILGLTRQQITDRYEAIVDFAELKDFIHQPIKHYSSGMYLRLAFAVAIHTDPSILLVDEILAVGDLSFQKKCLSRMRAFQDQGASIVVVTHSLDMVEKFCDRAAFFYKGELKEVGTPSKITQLYKKTAGIE